MECGLGVGEGDPLRCPVFRPGFLRGPILSPSVIIRTQPLRGCDMYNARAVTWLGQEEARTVGACRSSLARREGEELSAFQSGSTRP